MSVLARLRGMLMLPVYLEEASLCGSHRSVGTYKHNVVVLVVNKKNLPDLFNVCA